MKIIALFIISNLISELAFSQSVSIKHQSKKVLNIEAIFLKESESFERMEFHFEEQLKELQKIKHFKNIDSTEDEFCSLSSDILIDWDNSFNTKLSKCENFLISEISPNGKCEENALTLAILELKTKKKAISESKKICKYIKNGGLRGPFYGNLSCEIKNNFLIITEFLFEPDVEILQIFENNICKTRFK